MRLKNSFGGVSPCGGCLTAFAAMFLLASASPFLYGQQTTPADNPAKQNKPATSRFHEPEPLDFNDHTGYVPIFDGKTLNGWDSDPTVWRVENGTIVGESTKEKPTPNNNSYIVYSKVTSKDFDLKLEIKVENGGGSGIQYRSQTGLPWTHPLPANHAPLNLDRMMTGPQADFWYPVSPQAASYTGQFYSENTPLGIVAWRGEVVDSSAGVAPRLVGKLGDRDELGGYVKVNDWNQYLIMARGGVFIHILNGHVMAIYVDDDSKSSDNQAGHIGIELESVPSKVSVRNVWLKEIR